MTEPIPQSPIPPGGPPADVDAAFVAMVEAPTPAWARSPPGWSVPGRIPRAVETEELASIVERTVSSLPPRRREIFWMQREQGLSCAEIASLLGISVKTVEVQIGYALRAIRQRLGPLLAVAVTLLR